MNDIAALILQIIGVTSGVIGVMYRIQKGQASRHQEEHRELQEDLKELRSDLKGGLEELEKLRREGDRALHERVNGLEGGTYKEINTRLSLIEGELKGISNVSRIMQQWLVDHGGKVE